MNFSAAFIIASYVALGLACFVFGYFLAKVLSTCEESEIDKQLNQLYERAEKAKKEINNEEETYKKNAKHHDA